MKLTIHCTDDVSGEICHDKRESLSKFWRSFLHHKAQISGTQVCLFKFSLPYWILGAGVLTQIPPIVQRCSSHFSYS